MQQHDFDRFGAALTAVAELYTKSLSQGAVMLWWQSLERFDFEQVSRAIKAHTENAESGAFMPKPADLIRVLEGTATDKSAVAWGKVHDAMSQVGAYTDVVFDDAAIHAVVEDLGGWPKMCRGELKDLGYLQHRFCESYRAYVGRESFDYPRILGGDRSPDSEYQKKGLPAPKPSIVGNVEAARLVWNGGTVGGKTSISSTAFDALSFGSKMLEAA